MLDKRVDVTAECFKVFGLMEVVLILKRKICVLKHYLFNEGILPNKNE